VIQFDVQQVGDDWTLLPYHGDDELEESYLSSDETTRAEEVKRLEKAFDGFDGTYEEACDLISAWMTESERIEKGAQSG
jgi:hypothetical protein